MLDAVSLDHLRMFIAAADEGSLSAGGRRLRRAQSVISRTLANPEAQLGVKLFDRSSRSPMLNSQGLALLAEARAVVSRMDAFKAGAKARDQARKRKMKDSHSASLEKICWQGSMVG